MISPEDLALVLHDGARAAERKTLSAVLDTMADSLMTLAAKRAVDDDRFRADDIDAIAILGSYDAGHR